MGLSEQLDSAGDQNEEMEAGSDFDQEEDGSPKKVAGEESDEVEDE